MRILNGFRQHPTIIYNIKSFYLYLINSRTIDARFRVYAVEGGEKN